MESMCYFLYEKDGKRTLKPPPRGDISTDLVRITLQLTQEKVKKLKERAKQESARSLHDLYFSTFVVTMAYLWSCLVKARERYFGNWVFPIGYKAKLLSGRDGFLNAIEILGDSVKSLGSQGIEALASYFGWVKPVNDEIVSIDRYAAFTISERRDEIGGAEIGLCLKKMLSSYRDPAQSEMDTFMSSFNYGLDIIVSPL
ncbi:hypothetical protein ISN44_As03g031280 [Arabidopsis suecica]|uniref:Transferase-like protein n=2 Tax=Arabidopsis TaxID=3701 RepID=F4J479_ARATH|nr:transferase-like protein [Arabidopsis thaliana]AEE77596.1 transferase-like protein [Arabidopsis thaliana]KAG7633026.1 hypothetical protein ISN44_As03g031280 [Arabidopsis suecica]|eukprot:NP_683608.1 transferase-like protein [Arabidopsis thaliana]